MSPAGVKVERKKIHVILTNDQVVHFDRHVVVNLILLWRALTMAARLVALLLLGTLRTSPALDNGVARTPPMGFNSW